MKSKKNVECYLSKEDTIPIEKLSKIPTLDKQSAYSDYDITELMMKVSHMNTDLENLTAHVRHVQEFLMSGSFIMSKNRKKNNA